MIPVDPGWLVEALGVTQFDPALAAPGAISDKGRPPADPHDPRDARRTEHEDRTGDHARGSAVLIKVSCNARSASGEMS